MGVYLDRTAAEGGTYYVSNFQAAGAYALIANVAKALDLNGHQGAIEGYRAEAQRIAAKATFRDDNITRAMVYGEVLAHARKHVAVR